MFMTSLQFSGTPVWICLMYKVESGGRVSRRQSCSQMASHGELWVSECIKQKSGSQSARVRESEKSSENSVGGSYF